MACPVCFLPADEAARTSLNLGIFVLLGVTAVVLAGFVRFIVSLARRARTTPLVEERA
jgi:hypothetical protein